ncbi:hypothetical protein H3S75_13615 [Gilliamella sp. B14384G15]|nr:hypothetical protein [Gilliamella sp. B14384G15]MBI0059563.1 hypothetical protein [Gilliamella sp. B14384G12]
MTFKSRAFEVKEHPAGDPHDPFSKEEVEKGLLLRLARMDYPDQDQAMLCGPAAFFYCLLIWIGYTN